MKRPLSLWLLLASLLFLAFGGFYGGVALLADPSGRSMGMDLVLPALPVPDFVLPALFLLLGMGIVPLLLAYALLARPRWRWASSLLRSSRHHWAWTGTLALASLLAVWLVVQAAFIGFRWPIQYVTATNAVALVAFALAPRVRRSFEV